MLQLMTATITSTMLEGLTDAVTSNLEIVLPVCLGIFATLTGIKLIPKLVSMFIR